MGRILGRFLVLVTVFFGLWFLLGRINFVTRFHLDTISTKTEKKIGGWMIDNLDETDGAVDADSVQRIIDSLKWAICKPNKIDGSQIEVYIIKSNEVNAFALPGKYLVVYTGLIDYCNDPAELSGVMAHEIGHIQYNHVMSKVAREMGLGAVAAAAGGNTATAGRILKMLTSTAFDRRQESEADKAATEYCLKAGIDPQALASLMERIAQQRGETNLSEWVSTHPNSEKRAEAIRQQLAEAPKIMFRPPLSENRWKILKDAVGKLPVNQ